MLQKSSKDIILFLDASTTVKAAGWVDEVAFAADMMEKLTQHGNPNRNRLMLYWFNQDSTLVSDNVALFDGNVASGSSGMTNAVGHYSDGTQTEKSPLTGAMKALNFTNITFPATDHTQVYKTASQVFDTQPRPGAKISDNVVLMVTAGETWLRDADLHHDCKGLNVGSLEVLEKVGECRPNNDHACSPQRCHFDCICGLYTSEVFKDKGYKLVIVGIGHRSSIGVTKAASFKQMMETMASPNSLHYAADMFDLPGIAQDVFADLVS